MRFAIWRACRAASANSNIECSGVPGGVWFEGGVDGTGSNCLCIYLSDLGVLRNLLEVRVIGHCSSPVGHHTSASQRATGHRGAEGNGYFDFYTFCVNTDGLKYKHIFKQLRTQSLGSIS